MDLEQVAATCGGVGASAYMGNITAVPPYVPPSHHGAVIVVNSTLPSMNGPTSSLSALLGSGVPVTLVDAIAVTNAQPANYTIRFAANLSGATITLDGSDWNMVSLTGGNVLIEGNMTPDGPPAITITNSSALNYLLDLASSGNTVYGVTFLGDVLSNGGSAGLEVRPDVPQGNISRIVVAHDSFEEGAGLGLWADGSGEFDSDVLFEGDSFLNASVSTNIWGSSDRLSNFTIANNMFNDSSGLAGFPIGLGPGGWAGSGPFPHNDSFFGTTIENNTVSTAGQGAIYIDSGLNGGQNNTIENLTIVRNHIVNPQGLGVSLMTGDGANIAIRPTAQPIVYPSNNSIKSVRIAENEINNTLFSILLQGSPSGGRNSLIANVTIEGNRVWTDIPEPSGIQIWGGAQGGQPGRLTNNGTITNVTVAYNSIDLAYEGPLPPLQGNGAAIYVAGGEGADNNTIGRLLISHNEIQGEFLGVQIFGGAAVDYSQGVVGSPNVTGNVVQVTNLTCNDILDPPILAELPYWPSVSSIVVFGGYALGQAASGNSVTVGAISNNIVAGVVNNITTISNFSYRGMGASFANLVALPPKLAVAIIETGLAPGTRWSASLNNDTAVSTSATLMFPEWNGSLSYTVGNVTGYVGNPARGILNVSGPGQTLTIAFHPAFPLASVAISPNSTVVPVSGQANFTASPACAQGPCLPGTTFAWTMTHPLGLLNSSTGSVVSFTAGPSTGVTELFLNATLNGVTKEASATLTITSAASGPTISSFTAGPVTISLGWTTFLNVSASGGTGSLTYAYAGLPTGCPTQDSASWTCTPTSTGTFTVRAYVNDSSSHSATTTTSLTVNPDSGGEGVIISRFGASPASVQVGSATTFTVSAFGGSGALNYAYTGLPGGCATSDTASLTCAPISAGTFTVRVYVNDTASHSATTTTPLTVTPSSSTSTLSSVAISPSSASVATGGSVTFTASASCSGGTCPSGVTFVWALPALTTNPSGSLGPLSGPTTTYAAGTSTGTTTLELIGSLNGVSKTANATITIQTKTSSGGFLGLSGDTGYLLVGGFIAVAVIAVVALMVLRKRRVTATAEGAAKENAAKEEPSGAENEPPSESERTG